MPATTTRTETTVHLAAIDPDNGSMTVRFDRSEALQIRADLVCTPARLLSDDGWRLLRLIETVYVPDAETT